MEPEKRRRPTEWMTSYMKQALAQWELKEVPTCALGPADERGTWS